MSSVIPTVDPITAQQWLEQEEAIMIDVREPEEYATMHIPGTTLIPLGTIHAQDLPPLANKKLIIHCQSGKRSNMACEKLLAANPHITLYNLEGGILAWQHAGLPTK